VLILHLMARTLRALCPLVRVPVRVYAELNVPDLPPIVRDPRLLAVKRPSGKVALYVSALLASAGVTSPTQATAEVNPTAMVRVVSRRTDSIGAALILAPPQPTELLAQHSSHASHASHASHYSGSGGSAATPSAPAQLTSPATPTRSAAPGSTGTQKAVVPSASASSKPGVAGASGARKSTSSVAVRTPVTFTSEPALAEIEIDGKYAGSTRSVLQLSAGTHRIVINKTGYGPWTRTLEVTSHSELTVHADLQPVAHATPAK